MPYNFAISYEFKSVNTITNNTLVHYTHKAIKHTIIDHKQHDTTLQLETIKGSGCYTALVYSRTELFAWYTRSLETQYSP